MLTCQSLSRLSSPSLHLFDRGFKFKDSILQKIVETKAKGLVLDVSAIDVVDSFLVRQIGEIAASARVMGTRVAVSGLRPDVAMTLVEMGLTLKGVYTARDLEKGLEVLQKVGKG